MPPLKRIVTSPTFQEAVGAVAAAYLRLAWRTSRVTLEPSGIYESVEMPAIRIGIHFICVRFMSGSVVKAKAARGTADNVSWPARKAVRCNARFFLLW